MAASIQCALVVPRGRAARRLLIRALSRLSCLCLDLSDLTGRCAVDGDAARLHGFGDLALQFYQKQAVFEARALDLDMVRQGELASEIAGRDTAMQEGFPVLFGFLPVES